MRILFITYHYLNGQGGGVYASRAFINAFAENSENFTLIYPDNGIDISNYFDSKIVFKGINDKRSKLNKGIDVLFWKLHRYGKNTLNWITDNKDKFDIIVFDTSVIGDLVEKCNKLHLKTITIHHNVQIDYHRDNFSKSLFNKYFNLLIAKNERSSLLNSDLNLTLTEMDKRNLRFKYKIPIEKRIENVGCFEYLRFNTDTSTNLKKNKELTFIISGNLNSPQNELSLLPFLKNEWLILNEKMPNCKLIIAGSDPTNRIIEECSKYTNIDLIANPINMHDIIINADIYICPTCLGSGIKLRLMDGLKVGLPVISHEISERGYELFKEKGFLFSYNDSASFTEAIENVLKIKPDNFTRESIINLFNENFSFESGKKKIRKFIDSIN